MNRRAAVAGLLLGTVALAAGAQPEVRIWRERVVLDGTPCDIQLRASYEPIERRSQSPWPHARFTASGDCLPPGWQSRAALRVVQRSGTGIHLIDEAFDCQHSSGGPWVSCGANDAPLAGFYRRVWGPVRIASPQLARMHDEERRVLSEVRAKTDYAHFRDTWSETLWLRRFCGEARAVAHHFERWQACLAVMRPNWPQIFAAGEGLDYMVFEASAVVDARLEE